MEVKPTYEEWLAEGAVEHPTHIETLQKPEQQTRIEWLRRRIWSSVLDIGCNFGYVLSKIAGGHPACGIDINLENVDKGTREYPHLHFVQGDITQGLPYFDKHYGTVVLADILEHLEYEQVIPAITEALRIARKNVLITLPIKDMDDCAGCFKHKWIPNYYEARGIADTFNGTMEADEFFAYIELRK